jgi:hypothetical protein
MTMRLVLDAGTDDGALQRAYAANCDPIDDPVERDLCKSAVGPLVGTLANLGEPIAADNAAACLELNAQSGNNVLEVVNFGDVKIIRDSSRDCVPSFEPFSKNQFLTIPRFNWGFTDILDTRDDYLPEELPTVLTGDIGKFSFLDFDNLRPGEMNFFEILRGFGEFGETLDPSCQPGGSRAGSCGEEPYVPWAEFYAIANGRLVRQEVVGSYGAADYTNSPSLTATIDTGTQTTCRGPNLVVECKTTDPFETPGQPNPGSAIGASATAIFSDVVVISDDKTTIANEGGQAGGDKVRFTLDITNTSPAGSNIHLTSFNFQTKRRGLTDINVLDGTSIQGRQDLRTGADGTLPICGSDPFEAQCFDTVLGIGRFPNVIGNSLLSSVFAAPDPADPLYGNPDQAVVGQLEAIKKNGTFQPLMKTDLSAANFICIKSGPQSEDQDADETCSGIPTDSSGNPLGLATFDAGRGLWVLTWDTTTIVDTPLTKPRTQDELSVVVTVGTDQASDAVDVRVSNMLTARIFLPDNQEELRGYEDLEALVESEFNITSVRFDLYNISDIDPEILIPFGEASESGEPIEDRKYGRPLGDPEWPKGSPVYQIGNVVSEGATRWVFRNWDTKTIPDGTYGLVATAFDATGRKATYMIETYIVNDLRVVISAPSDGTAVSRFVALEVRTSGLFPATGVVFNVGGTDIMAAETSPGSGRWRAVWNGDSFSPGPYTITATATSIAGEVVTDLVNVTLVAPSAELEAFFPFDWSNCIRLECNFLDGSGGGPTSWEWDFDGDGVVDSTDQLPTHTYSTWGVYTVTLTVSNDGGITIDTYSRVIPVGNIDVVDFNTNPINDAQTEFITWTSAFKDFAYEVGSTIAVPAMWKSSRSWGE